MARGRLAFRLRQSGPAGRLFPLTLGENTMTVPPKMKYTPERDKAGLSEAGEACLVVRRLGQLSVQLDQMLTCGPTLPRARNRSSTPCPAGSAFTA